ncbi:unnamed protein product, partial [Phaeothamnion confervicola]
LPNVRAAGLLCALCVGLAGAADDYPSRPVRMMIPFPAGGPSDFVGRLLAQNLTDLWGKQIVVDNRAGASGIIGTEIAVRSNPDGYTLLFGTNSTFAVNLVLIKNLPYDVFRDLALIGLVAEAPHILAVREGFPAKNVKELIALAKQQPGAYKFSSSGTGTIVHMAGELFKYSAGIDIVHVPYKGGTPATLSLLTGEVDMLVNDLSTLLVHVKSGKVRAFAAAHTKRLPPLPDVPTMAEFGMPGDVSSTWWAVAVPVKTPAAVRAKIVETQNKILARPEYAARLAELAMEPLKLTPEQAAEVIKREIEKWRKVAAAANIRPE